MTFNDTVNLNGIIQTVERLTDVGQAYISGDDTRLKETTATINRINHRVWHNIFMSTGNWQYDDGGQTDLPVATTDIVDGQSTYSLPSGALTVQRIEAKDENGLWTTLTPITKESITGAVDEFMDTDGSLRAYRLVNGVIELFPASNYDSTDSLKVYFDRDSVDFAYDDTTATPGFASPYHEILPIMTAIEWYKVKQAQSPTLPQLQQDQLRLEKSIKDFYGIRFNDYKPKVGRAKQSYR
ncbi:MAG: hypothetical protein PF488_02930 [Patescibacteria group bacterium]|jgi:hypothetical protein|nr:hypothetical protein [Patescibacteria group bacterium]